MVKTSKLDITPKDKIAKRLDIVYKGKRVFGIIHATLIVATATKPDETAKELIKDYKFARKRTKNQISGSKSKGSQMEYSVQDSLKELYPDLRLTKELGFVSQHDLVSDVDEIAIECKCHVGFSWNELVKTFNKLKTVMPQGYKPYLIFKANRQPVLVMTESCNNCYCVEEFETTFGLPFTKHVGVKKNV